MRRVYETLLGAAGDVIERTDIKGTITPEDFVKYGDLLVETSINWKWCVEDKYSSNNELIANFISSDKQFLYRNRVNCIKLPNVELKEDTSWKVFSDSAVLEESKCSDPEDDDVSFLTDNDISHKFYRTYDVSITYDKFYETPRLWLYGYNQIGLPLTKDEMLMDVPSYYIGESITIERHPHSGRFCLTVHPCYQINAINNTHITGYIFTMD